MCSGENISTTGVVRTSVACLSAVCPATSESGRSVHGWRGCEVWVRGSYDGPLRVRQVKGHRPLVLTLQDQYFAAINDTNTSVTDTGSTGIFRLGFPLNSAIWSEVSRTSIWSLRLRNAAPSDKELHGSSPTSSRTSVGESFRLWEVCTTPIPCKRDNRHPQLKRHGPPSSSRPLLPRDPSFLASFYQTSSPHPWSPSRSSVTPSTLEGMQVS